MSTVGQIETHQPIVWSHDCLIDLEICGGAAQALNIDTPSLRVKIESLESAGLARQLHCINVLISAIISCSWVSLAVLVGHGGTKGIEDGAGSNIFGGNEDD